MTSKYSDCCEQYEIQGNGNHLFADDILPMIYGVYTRQKELYHGVSPFWRLEGTDTYMYKPNKGGSSKNDRMFNMGRSEWRVGELKTLQVSGLAVTFNNLYKTIPMLHKQWRISLEIMPTGVVNGYSSIVLVGLGGDNEVYGDRSPGIWFKPASTELVISSAINGYKNYNFTTPAIPMHEFTNIEISQLEQSNGSYQYTIRLRGTILHQLINSEPTEFEDVHVYASNNFHAPANALISNLIIEAGGALKTLYSIF